MYICIYYIHIYVYIYNHDHWKLSAAKKNFLYPRFTTIIILYQVTSNAI